MYHASGYLTYLADMVAWTDTVKGVLVLNKTSYQELEIIIGRMIHVGIVIPPIHTFMSRLRDLVLTVIPPIGPWKKQKKNQKRDTRITLG